MIFQKIDYVANNDKTRLHKLAPGLKLFFLVLVIVLVLNTYFIDVLLMIFVFLLLLVIVFKLPLGTTFFPSLFPLIFLLLFFLSIDGISPLIVLIYSLRAISVTLALLITLNTTAIIKIFSILSAILPAFLVTAIFFTYRAIFILEKNFYDIKTAYYLRGALSIKKPALSIVNLSRGLGFLIIRSIEHSTAQAEILNLRGFDGKIYFK